MAGVEMPRLALCEIRADWAQYSSWGFSYSNSRVGPCWKCDVKREGMYTFGRDPPWEDRTHDSFVAEASTDHVPGAPALPPSPAPSPARTRWGMG